MIVVWSAPQETVMTACTVRIVAYKLIVTRGARLLRKVASSLSDQLVLLSSFLVLRKKILPVVRIARQG